MESQSQRGTIRAERSRKVRERRRAASKMIKNTLSEYSRSRGKAERRRLKNIEAIEALQTEFDKELTDAGILDESRGRVRTILTKMLKKAMMYGVSLGRLALVDHFRLLYREGVINKRMAIKHFSRLMPEKSYAEVVEFLDVMIGSGWDDPIVSGKGMTPSTKRVYRSTPHGGKDNR